jgi:diguanylate cyclase (GGDEF)-like protein
MTPSIPAPAWLLAHLRGQRVETPARGTRRLLLFAAVLGCAGAALWMLPLRGAHQPEPGGPVPWWALLLACYACSVLSVRVRVQRTSSTVSLTEIPVVVGLFLAAPRVLLVTYVAGVLLGNWTRRGVRPAPDAGNLMLDVLSIAVTVLVFDAVGPLPHDPLAPRSVAALVAAMAATGWVVGPLAVNAGLVLYEGTIDRDEWLRAYMFQAAATLINTCLGVIALAIVVSRPLIAIALLPPVALVFAGQLAATDGQRRAARMEFLYTINELLHSGLPAGERYAELLNACRQAFASDRAELIVIPDSDEAPVRFQQGGRAHNIAIASAPLTFSEQEVLTALRDHPVLSPRHSDQASPLGLLLEERGASGGTAALLQGHERVLGMLLLLDPLRSAAGMRPAERNLLATVSGQLSVALENGQLADAVRAMAAEREDLTRRASHDPLTQLPNRALFADTVESAIQRLPKTLRHLAVMFIDLDGFKAVNDTRGHAAGDEVLCSIAARLCQHVRKHDLAARLGGDEFAVLLTNLREVEDARMVATRIVDSLLAPVRLGHQTVTLGGSIGVAVMSAHGHALGADELLRRADMAMYLAKRQGKGRFVVFDAGARDAVLVAPSPLDTREPQPIAG